MSEDGGDHIHEPPFEDPAQVAGPPVALTTIHRHCHRCQEEHTMKVFDGPGGVTWLRCPCCCNWTQANIDNTPGL